MSPQEIQLLLNIFSQIRNGKFDEDLLKELLGHQDLISNTLGKESLKRLKDAINIYLQTKNKSELIKMAQTLETSLNELMSRREAIGFFGKAAAVVAGVGLGLRPGSAFAEESRLSESEFPSLNEGNYRRVINAEPICIVMYYRTDGTDNNFADSLMIEFKKKLPTNIRYYKVNLKPFSVEEKAYVIQNDVGKDLVPSIVSYKGGNRNVRIRGPPEPPNFNRLVETFAEYLK